MPTFQDPSRGVRRSLVRCALLVASSVFLCSGCNRSNAPTDSSVADSQPEPDTKDESSQPVEPPESGAPVTDGDSVIVNGGLDTVDWRSMVGKEITIEGQLMIVDTYDLARRGQVVVARERLFVPTSRVDPNDADPNGNSYKGGGNVSKVVAAQKFNDRATLTLDDGSSEQNLFPPALFPELGKAYPTVRMGSILNGVSGTLVEQGNQLLLNVKQPLNWTPSVRPDRPTVGKAEVTVASFNVLNYFTTIDDGSNGARGADSDTEFDRQEAKIVSAITSLDADVIGLMEIQNNVDAEERLITALNAKAGKDVYQGCGVPDGFSQAPGGSDAIRVGIIYRSDRVSPVGEVSLINDSAFFVARTPIVQTFRSGDDDEPFTVVVNHFKSKGGASNADAVNKDKGDGQAAYNAARRDQALAVVDFIDAMQAKRADARVLVIGDLNAYQQEDPIDALRAKGLVDLYDERSTRNASNQTTDHYSYVYYGQCGSLDHALATKSLARIITGIATWHINADEPRFLDYNQEYNPSDLFEPDPFRSSDHDPVLIGIGR